MFAFGATCKLMYGRVMNHTILSWGIRLSMTDTQGSMRWIYPVRTLEDEWVAAYKAIYTWLPTTENLADHQDNDSLFDEELGNDDEDVSEGASVGITRMEVTFFNHIVCTNGYCNSDTPDTMPFFQDDFPLLAFLRAYIQTDHARARRRRWDIIKQFDVLWTDYRRDGWEKEDFVPEGTVWTESYGELTCSHPA